MNCEYENICLNTDKCYRCSGYKLLKTKDKKRENKISSIINSQQYKTSNASDSWKDLEQQVADKLNNIPTIQDARRSRASGALWFEKGDIVDTILHPECKERKGNCLKTGEKSMSIKKDWLDKASQECMFENKTMCLPFRFKGDKNIYCIFNNNDIASLITTMKAYMIDNERKQKEIDELKSIIEQMKNQ